MSSVIAGIASGATALKNAKDKSEKAFKAVVIISMIIAFTFSIILFIEAANTSNNAYLISAAVINLIAIGLLIYGLWPNLADGPAALCFGFLFVFVSLIIATVFYKNFVLVDQNGSVSLGTFASIMIYYIFIFIMVMLAVCKLSMEKYNIIENTIRDNTNIGSIFKN